jgi:hypothetical protein
MMDEFDQVLAKAKADPDDWVAFERLAVLVSRRGASLARVLLGPLDNGAEFDRYGADRKTYSDLLASMGEVITEESEGSYQGDTFVLLKRGSRYAYFTFGWGSCSGCDAMEACNSWEDVEQIRDGFFNTLRWQSPAELIKFIREHDWAGDFNRPDESRLAKMIEHLEGR